MGTTSRKLWGRFNDAPLVVQAYLVFAVIASILSLSGIVSQPLNQALVPYMGWSGLSLYMFTLYFTIGPVFSSSPLLRRTIFLNVFMLGVFVVIGSREMIQHLSAPKRDFGNPYLTYHVWRPAFTICAARNLAAAVLVAQRVEMGTKQAPRRSPESPLPVFARRLTVRDADGVRDHGDQRAIGRSRAAAPGVAGCCRGDQRGPQIRDELARFADTNPTRRPGKFILRSFLSLARRVRERSHAAWCLGTFERWARRSTKS